MARTQLAPLSLITLWHPEHWLGLGIRNADELRRYPHVLTDRRTKEERRKAEAQARGIHIQKDMIHGGEINNTGLAIDKYRYTIFSDSVALSECLHKMDIRLIYTAEQRPQSKWKFEARYDWGVDSKPLPRSVVYTICDAIKANGRLSIRQLWLNPTKARFGGLRIPQIVLEQPYMANLVLGPLNSHEPHRPARIRISENQGAWWVDYEP